MKSFIENKEKNSQLLHANSKLLLTNKFQFIHPYDMEPCREIVDLSENIDWEIIPFDDDEWNFMLNRQEYLMDLCVTYEMTGETKYLKKAKELLLDWIVKNKDAGNWRTIDTGIRLIYWKIALDCLLKEKAITNKELVAIKKSVIQQLVYLDNNYIEKYDLSNWGVLITSGYFIIQLFFKESASEEMNQRMLKRLEKQLYLQIQPSGNHWEQSPLYFMEVLRSFVFLHVSKAITDEKLNQKLEKTILLMYQFMPHFITPEGHSILQGDTDEMIIDDAIQTIALLYNCSIPELFTQTPSVDYLILYLSGKTISFKEWCEGIKNLENNQFSIKLFDDYTGNYYYRNTWETDSDYLHLYNGALGSGHGHLSLGHFDLALRGNNLFVDSGRFTYVESDIRRKLKESTHHNTLTINDTPFGIAKDSWGYEEVPTSLMNRYADKEHYVAMRSMYLEKQKNTIFKVVRTIIYFKAERDFLVIDQVINQSNKRLNTMNRHFHLNPKLEVLNQKNYLKLSLKEVEEQIIYTYFSEDTLEILDTEYSPVYNELTESKKIRTTSMEAHQYLFITLSDKVEINKIDVKKSDNQVVKEEKCLGIQIKIGEIEYLIHSSIEDTFEGHKLYILNDLPVYGQLSIHKKVGDKSEYERLL